MKRSYQREFSWRKEQTDGKLTQKDDKSGRSGRDAFYLEVDETTITIDKMSRGVEACVRRSVVVSVTSWLAHISNGSPIQCFVEPVLEAAMKRDEDVLDTAVRLAVGRSDYMMETVFQRRRKLIRKKHLCMIQLNVDANFTEYFLRTNMAILVGKYGFVHYAVLTIFSCYDSVTCSEHGCAEC